MTLDPTDFGSDLPAGTPDVAGPDPFDLDSLRLTDSAEEFGAEKVIVTVPVRKPDKDWFVRVHPSEAFCLHTRCIEVRDDNQTEIYLVAKPLWPALAGEPKFAPRALYTAINRQNVVFLWPVKLPPPDGRRDTWSQSALKAAALARVGWVRVHANMALSAYEIRRATGNIPDPQWPTVEFKDLLGVAFHDRIIESLNHPVLQRLRGEL